MAWIVDPKQHYSRVVTEPESGQEAEVVLRKLTERDLQERDGKSISFNDSGKITSRKNRRGKGKRGSGDVSFTPGQVRMFEIQRSVVSWTIPVPLNAMSINNLDPEVSQQIHDHIVDLNPFFFDGNEDEDEDENTNYHDMEDVDFNDEDQVEDLVEGLMNGSEEPEGYDTDEENPKVQYGQFDGPKGYAAKN